MPSEGIAGSTDGELPRDGRAFSMAITNPGEDLVLELLSLGKLLFEVLHEGGVLFRGAAFVDLGPAPAGQ